MSRSSTPKSVKAFDSSFPPKFLRVGAYNLSYRECGQGERVIVMIHGNPTWSFLYRKLMSSFSSYRVVCPDLLGFGYSDKPTRNNEYRFDAHVDRVEALLRCLNITQPILIGQDWGGPIAAALSSRFTSNKLVVMNTYLPGLPVFNKPLRRLLRTKIGKGMIVQLDLYRLFAFRLGFIKRISGDTRRAYMWPHRTTASRQVLWTLPSQIPEPSPHDDKVKRINAYYLNKRVHKLVLWGEKDVAFDSEKAKQSASRIPKTTFVTIKNAGHYLQEDQPNQVAREILSWLGHQNQ